MQVQNFDQAYNNTLKTLNFREEELAKSLFKSKQCNKEYLRVSSNGLLLMHSLT